MSGRTRRRGLLCILLVKQGMGIVIEREEGGEEGHGRRREMEERRGWRSSTLYWFSFVLLYIYHTLLLETITRISFSLQNCLTRSDRNLSRNLAVIERLYTISKVFLSEGLYRFLIFQGESFIHSLVGWLVSGLRVQSQPPSPIFHPPSRLPTPHLNPPSTQHDASTTSTGNNTPPPRSGE